MSIIKRIKECIRPCIFVAMGIYSLMFSLSVVASNHILISGGEYSTYEVNYITPYGISDIAIFIFVATLCFTLGLFFLAVVFPKQSVFANESQHLEVMPLKIKPIVCMATLLFFLYVPYLITYWPGLIFGDSVSSLSQALGYSEYSNHHPLLFTLCIKACLFVAHTFQLSNSAGCALFSIIQMSLLSLCFASLIQWAMQRTKCHRIWGFLLLAFFGLSPYFATYTIAMWKDPFFSAAISMMTVLLFDLLASRGRIIASTKLWLPLFALTSVVVAFFRSNGILVVALLGIILLAIALKSKSNRYCMTPALTTIGTAIVALLVTGPLLTAIGVTPAAKAEGLGIPLNQMARVVAMDGAMSDEDKNYLNELLPLELYETTYTPTCVDSFKWNANFNAKALSDHFLVHWLSLGFKNPLIYLEAWELQTVGYWSVNQPEVLLHNRNIAAGEPRTESDSRGLEAWGIYPQNKFENDTALKLFRTDRAFIPVGWLTWLSVFTAIAFANCRKPLWTVTLVPTFAIIASLLAASPIWYWERYAVALQFLLPFYIGALICAKRQTLAQHRFS